MSRLFSLVVLEKPLMGAAHAFLVQLVSFQAPITGILYSTHNDARYPSVATVHYPLHPLYGRGSLPIRQRVGTGSTEVLLLDAEHTGQVVPAWMSDEQRCTRMTIGCDPRCSIASLLDLLSLVHSTGL
jgi:hypothetical protein